HQHLLDHATIHRIDVRHGLECRERHLMAVGPHARPPHRDLAATQDDFAAHGPGARGVAIGRMRIPRPAQGNAILFEHRFQYLQARADGKLEQLGPSIDEQIDQREMSGRFNSDRVSTCARLLHGGPFFVGLSPRVWLPRGFSRAAAEPPLQFSTAIGTSPLEGPNGVVKFSPDGKILAAGWENGDLDLWEVATRTKIATPRGHK